MRTLLIACVCVLALTVTGASAGIIHVPADQPTIQGGINAAAPGDTVIVASGIYNESILFYDREVTVRSESGPYSAVIHANGMPDALLFYGLTGPETIVRGFTLTGATEAGARCYPGTGPTLENMIISYNGGYGLKCIGGSPTVTGSEFASNQDGGIYVNSGSATLSSCTVVGGGSLIEAGSSLEMTDCSFSASAARGPSEARGPGLKVTNSGVTATDCDFVGYTGTNALALYYPEPVTLTDCVFKDNEADRGPALFAEGAAATYAAITVTRCEFTGNSSSENGGAVVLRWSEHAIFTDCTFRENTTPGLGGAINTHDSETVEYHGCEFFGNYAGNDGGGVRGYGVTGSDVTVDHCLFVGNSCGDRGAAIRFSDCTGEITNCTIYDCDASPEGGSIHLGCDAPPDIVACIIANGEGYGVTMSPDDMTPLVLSSDVYGMSSGAYGPPVPDYTGVYWNISADPMFCDPLAGDFMLDEHSPCATGTPGGTYMGAFPVGCGGTAVEQRSWGAIKALYR